MVVLQNKVVKTKKEHRCYGCNRTFDAGAMLKYIAEADSGKVYSTYWCQTCDVYWATYMDNGDEILCGDLKGYGGEMWESLRERIEEGKHEE